MDTATTFYDNPEIPKGFTMSQNFPNPFKAKTTVRFHIPEPALVNLVVYNTSGQLVEILVNKFKNAGSHTVTWNATGISSGLYYIWIQTGDYINVEKCVILR